MSRPSSSIATEFRRAFLPEPVARMPVSMDTSKKGPPPAANDNEGGALCNDGVFVWTGFDPNRGHGSFLRNENNVTRTNYREHTLVIVILATMLSTN